VSAIKRLVISQPMLFPWVGLLEQMRLADIFVYYDDVQFSKGGFVNRVQLKLPEGIRWMTLPIKELHLGQRINELLPHNGRDWRRQHLDLLARSFAASPFRNDALGLVEHVYAGEYTNLGGLSRASMIALADYFGLISGRRFVCIDELGVNGSGTDRVLEVVKRLEGKTYITGHGAARYLNHEKFEKSGISVEYMNYLYIPYPQTNGPFTPYVSALDLVANLGRAGIEVIASNTKPWREFLNVRN
jgi:hypothetical protein